MRRPQSHNLPLPPRRMLSDLRDLSSSEEEDEEEAGVECPLTDEWEHVVPFLEPAAAMRLARTSKFMLVMIGTTMITRWPATDRSFFSRTAGGRTSSRRWRARSIAAMPRAWSDASP